MLNKSNHYIKNNNKFVAIIPARGGSKSIKNKNLLKINNKTLVEHALEFAVKSKIFFKIILSSDSKKILRKAKKINNQIIVDKRPKSLSGDTISTEQVLFYIHNKYLKCDKFNFFVILEPTSPLRKISELKKCLKLLENKDKSILSVTKIEHTPGIIIKNKFKFIKNERRRRQDRRSYYVENGNFYIVNKKYFLKEKKIVDKINNYYSTSIASSIDINSYEDYKIAKKLYNI